MCSSVATSETLLLTHINFIPAIDINNYIPHKVLYEITYLFQNFNDATEHPLTFGNGLIIYFILLYWAYDYLSKLILKLIHVSKRDIRTKHF